MVTQFLIIFFSIFNGMVIQKQNKVPLRYKYLNKIIHQESFYSGEIKKMRLEHIFQNENEF